VRETRPRLASFVEQRVQVALSLGSSPPLPGFRDEIQLVVVDLRERTHVVRRVHDHLLAVERRIEIGNDADPPFPLLREYERLRRRHVLVTRFERTGRQLLG
jgi:hypothetical protein